MKTNWRAIAVFYVIACTWSWPFFWLRDMQPKTWTAWQIPGFLKNCVIMWGPAIAAVLATLLLKTGKWSSTFFGASLWRSSAIFLTPFVAPFVSSNFCVDSTLGEEIGWRGFLQPSLVRQNRITRYISIGVLWEFWHFTSRTHVGPLPQIFVRVSVFTLLLIIVSFVIGEAVEKTKSLLVAAALHVSFNLLMGEDTGRLAGCSYFATVLGFSVEILA